MSSGLNFDDIQGDILVGLPKKVQQYVIFQIDDNNVAGFRQGLNKLIPLITTTTQVMQDRTNIAANKQAAQEQGKSPDLLTLTGVNIAFSHAGLVKMGITDNIRDGPFSAGQQQDSQSLGDQGDFVNGRFSPKWDPAFKGVVHGVILISGDSDDTVTNTRKQIEGIFNLGSFNSTIHEAITLSGSVRPGDQKGHEHFGFLDGISQPAVKGVDTNPNPGQETVRQGVILCGRDGDNALLRPSWAKDGSFMVLRWYDQLVPEFNTFLDNNPLQAAFPDRKAGSELLGARLVGRWKSGAPVDISPLKDDPALGADPLRNNNFSYNFPGDPDNQERCPFAAHTRKSNPRHDLEGLPIPVPTEPHRILRRGIPFGPEVSPDEAASGVTASHRGLIFVCYQSSIDNGFKFIQTVWANDIHFPPKGVLPLLNNFGFDPIIGQAADPTSRTINGTDPLNTNTQLKLPQQWVVPRGGEYFFSPSLPTLRNKFALAS